MRLRKERFRSDGRFQIADFGFGNLQSDICNPKSPDTDEEPPVVVRQEQLPNGPGKTWLLGPQEAAALADGSLFPGGPPCSGGEVRDFPVLSTPYERRATPHARAGGRGAGTAGPHAGTDHRRCDRR